MKDCLGLMRQREWIEYRLEGRLFGHPIQHHPPGAACVCSGEGLGTDTGGGTLNIKCQLVIMTKPTTAMKAKTIIKPLPKRLGDVLMMWFSSCES